MTTLAPTHVLIASGLAQLAEQNPIRIGAVSPHRTYDGDGFRIRQLAFDAGAVLAEHTAPVPIVIHVVQGAVTFDLGDECHELASGAILHVGAHVPHQVTAREPSRLVVTLLG